MKSILGFDPNKFKYESSDGKTTTLRHKNGHKITIAHSVLSDENRKVLEAMAPKKPETDMAIGGKVDSNDHLASGSKKGVSTQGEDVRRAKRLSYDYDQSRSNHEKDRAMAEAKGRIDLERHIKPNMKGLAKGGSISIPRERSPLSEASDKQRDEKMREFYKTEHGKKALEAANTESDKIRSKTKMAKGGNIDNPAEGLDFNAYEQARDEANHAYDAGLPCLNPHCKSHGSPHPNCRCYSGGEKYASGGEVMKLRYCAHGKPHMPGCQYAEGGGATTSPSDRYLIQPEEAPIEPGPALYPQGFHDKTTSAQDAARHQQMDQEDEAFRRSGMAQGGMPQRSMPGQLQRFEKGTPDKPIEADLPQSDVQGDVSNIPYGVMGVSKRQPNEYDLEEKMKAKEAEAAGNDESTISDSELDQSPEQQPAEQPQAPVQTQPDPNQPQAQQPQAADQASAQPQPQQNQPPADPVQQYQQGVHDDIMNEARNWSMDMAQGHIQPETYKSLFHKKDTLGMVGTIFGLLLGSGSRLNPQPNALLSMMQKQIDNDLDAQKTSATNKLNFIKAAQQHELNKATIANAAAGRKLTTGQAALVDQQAHLAASMNAQRSVIADLAEKNKLITDPQQRQAADQALAMLYQKMDASNSDAASRFAAAKSLAQFGNTQPNGGEQSFQQRQSALQMAGMGDRSQFETDRHIPGVQGQASQSVPQNIKDEVHAMNVLDAKGQDLLQFVKQHSGTWNPQTRAQAEQKVEEMKNFYNGSINGGALTQGRLKWYDEQFKKAPTDIIPQLLGSTKKFEEVINSNKMRRDLRLKDLGFPPQNQQKPQEAMSKSGKPMIMVNGTWQYK